eukprot:CAMPEP_0181290896 /NCGR_PEP_ID=MMETSP1101-20121128/1668_1 /TAXON_ID=46948 /ORGANISM="Rhodomonas abbreviata, Strain Caron Lab Isolate" /LENGTH=158 /DNA_ID=CAMNT_0023395231 /DNA_START=9 /DNA_END=485 /DNA_ORIENTATION=+
MVSMPKFTPPLLLLVLCTFSSVAAQWSDSSTCTESEVSGINMCQSAGEGFAMNQAKYESCPQAEDTDPNAWSCDQWQCHVYCSNPVRPEARKSCTNCDEVKVSEECWTERQSSCDTAKTKLDSCDDLVCSVATTHHGLKWTPAVWMGGVVLMTLIAGL